MRKETLIKPMTYLFSISSIMVILILGDAWSLTDTSRSYWWMTAVVYILGMFTIITGWNLGDSISAMTRSPRLPQVILCIAHSAIFIGLYFLVMKGTANLKEFLEATSVEGIENALAQASYRAMLFFTLAITMTIGWRALKKLVIEQISGKI